MIHFRTLTVLILAFPFCAFSIIAGSPSSDCSVVLLQNIPGETGFTCSGTLLRQDILITAAHCLCEPGEFDSVSGNICPFGSETTNIVVNGRPKVVMQKETEAGLDIAIVKLDSMLNLPDQCLKCLGENCEGGGLRQVLGFGSTTPFIERKVAKPSIQIGDWPYDGFSRFDIYSEPGDSGGPVTRSCEVGKESVVGVTSGNTPHQTRASDLTPGLVRAAQAMSGKNTPRPRAVSSKIRITKNFDRHLGSASCFDDFYNDVLGVPDSEDISHLFGTIAFSMTDETYRSTLLEYIESGGQIAYSFSVTHEGLVQGQAFATADRLEITAGNLSQVICTGDLQAKNCKIYLHRGFFESPGAVATVNVDAAGSATCGADRGESSSHWRDSRVIEALSKPVCASPEPPL